MPTPPPGYEWHDEKAKANLRKHGVSFAAVVDFDFENALFVEEQLHGKETRYVVIGRIKRSVCVLVYTTRDDKIRPISLRKAEKRERIAYGKAKGQF
jgi:uncharacterized DUF497 family protein